MILNRLENMYRTLTLRASGKNAGWFRLAYQALPYYLSRGGYSFPPINLWFSINTSCNYRCKTCDIGQRERSTSFYKNIGGERDKELPLEKIEQLAEEMRRFKPHVHICCVEPLLHRQLTDIVRCFARHGMMVDLTTNGYLLKQNAAGLVDAGIRNLWVSIDGPAEVHNKIRGVSDAFERAYTGIEEIVRIRESGGQKLPKINILCVISDHNYLHLEAMLESVSNLQVERILFGHMNFVSHEMADAHNEHYEAIYHAVETNMKSISPRSIDTARLAATIQAIKRKYGRLVGFSPQMTDEEIHQYYFDHTKHLKNRKCYLPWGAAQINADGDVIIFSRCMNISVGNVYKSSFSDIWNGEKMRQFRINLRNSGAYPVCSRCSGLM